MNHNNQSVYSLWQNLYNVSIYIGQFLMQWFRNLQLYRLAADHPLPTADELNDLLAKHPFIPCGAREFNTQGFSAPASHAPDLYAYPQQEAVLICLKTEEKLLPGAVVKQFVDDKIEDIQARDHRKVGNKERKELTEQVRDELLPRAFGRQRSVYAIIDYTQRLIIIDSANASRAENVLSKLREALGSFPARLINTEQTPASAMTTWLEDGAPQGFTLDADCELKEMGDAGAIVRYRRQNLDSEEVKNHLTAGKIATQLAMSWADKISFNLTEKLEIKRVAMLVLLADTLQEQDTETTESLLMTTLALMLGEFRLFLPELLTALGGESV
jgi:recombination associated protein RdgC